MKVLSLSIWPFKNWKLELWQNLKEGVEGIYDSEKKEEIEQTDHDSDIVREKNEIWGRKFY